jgi:hypothetical protein
MPQKKVKLTPAGPKGTPGRQSTLTKAGSALRQAKDRAAEPPVKSLGGRLDQAAANEKRAATRQANKDAAMAARQRQAAAEKRAATREANKAAKSAAQAELNKTRESHLDPHNTPHQIHGHIGDITNDIFDSHINGNHNDLVSHAQHLARVLNKHPSSVEYGKGGAINLAAQSRQNVERAKELLRRTGKNKKVPADIRDKANRIADDHLTHHAPDANTYPVSPVSSPKKVAKPGIVSRIKKMFEEVELHEDYGAGDVGTDEVVRKYKSMTPGEKKTDEKKVKLSESYVLWLAQNEQE